MCNSHNLLYYKIDLSFSIKLILILISSKEHCPANVAVEAISMILFYIINGKPSAIE